MSGSAAGSLPLEVPIEVLVTLRACLACGGEWEVVQADYTGVLVTDKGAVTTQPDRSGCQQQGVARMSDERGWDDDRGNMSRFLDDPCATAQERTVSLLQRAQRSKEAPCVVRAVDVRALKE